MDNVKEECSVRFEFEVACQVSSWLQSIAKYCVLKMRSSKRQVFSYIYFKNFNNSINFEVFEAAFANIVDDKEFRK